MAQLDVNNLARELVPGVRALLQVSIAEATEEVINEATAQFEQRLRAAIAETVMNVSSYFDVERIGAGVVITVKDVRSS